MTNVVGWWQLPYRRNMLAIPKVAVDSKGELVKLEQQVDRGIGAYAGDFSRHTSSRFHSYKWQENSSESIDQGVSEMLTSCWSELRPRVHLSIDEKHRQFSGYAGPDLTSYALENLT